MSYAATPQGSALSSASLRDLLRQALDKLDALQGESKAAQDYIATLEKAEKKDNELIAALQERDAIRKDTISALDAQVAALKEAISISDKARIDAVKEAERQKKSAHRWKKFAKLGTMAGVVAGAAAILLIKR